MDFVVFVAGLLALGLASVHDIRTREVPDLVSYGLLLFSVSYGAAKALLLGSWQPLLSMLLGLCAMVALGFLLFYLGQWGGADSKLLMGLGALLGLGFGSYDLLLFLVLSLFSGATYGLLYTAGLAFKERKAFVERFRRIIREPRIHTLRTVVVTCCFLLLFAAVLAATYRPALIVATIAVYLMFYLWLSVKAVEQAVLIKEYPVGKLTEGDWILKDVMVRGKRVCGPKDLGISEEQIAELKRLKVKKVWVKEGIPFVPSFLVAYVLLWLLSPLAAPLMAALFP
jgi:Flp pilus assembly protein protease CpaA